jgi:uncharacterized Tic20 family protein
VNYQIRENKMDNQAANVPSQEERIMAALSHIAVLLPFMGTVIPIVIWVTQKEKSRYVGFQALQATVLQLALLLIWFAGMACYMATFFLSFFGTILMSSASSSSQGTYGPETGLASLAFIIPVLVMVLMGIGFIVFEIYGIVGAIQCLRGKAFRYVIIGDRVERFLQQGKSEAKQPVDDRE